MAIYQPDLFKLIFEYVPIEQRLEMLSETIDQEGNIVFDIIKTLASENFQYLLESLPEEIAMVFNAHLQTNDKEILDCATSIEIFMQDMQAYAPPESIKAFVHAIIKNEGIESAKASLFSSNTNYSLFQSNSREAIQQCIEKLHPYWLTRIHSTQELPRPKS